MLNKIWFALIVFGILSATLSDVLDIKNDTYKTDKKIAVSIHLEKGVGLVDKGKYEVRLKCTSQEYSNHYDVKIPNGIEQTAELFVSTERKNFKINIFIDDNSPEIWKTMASSSGESNILTALVTEPRFVQEDLLNAKIIPEKTSLVNLKKVTHAVLSYAEIAVNIALGLIGIMALWLGIMKIAEQSGLINIIARALRPLTKFLFPNLPQDHPAIGAIIMNLSANMLGLGNAATPFGLKAMEELEKENKTKGVATNEMCTFLAVNTAGLTLIPATAIAIRAAAGSSDPTIIIATSIFGATCATIVGITGAKLFEFFSSNENSFLSVIKEKKKKIFTSAIIILSLIAAIIFVSINYFDAIIGNINLEVIKDVIQIISFIAIPFIILSFLIYGIVKKVKVYEAFVDGAKEGFTVAIKIIPYLVGMLVAIGIFRAGGGMDYLISLITPITNLISFPAEALPMALMRPLSGSGSIGIMTELMATHGADSFIGVLSSTILGSTETTFYVIAVYFGAVNIKKTRHALTVGLMADIAGILGALLIVKLLFGA